MFRQYPEFFTDASVVQGDKDTAVGLLLTLRHGLRKAWETQNPRQKEWSIVWLRMVQQLQTVKQELRAQFEAVKAIKINGVAVKDVREHESGTSAYAFERLATAPPITFLECCLFYFQRIADRAKRCSNEHCHTPYFVAEKRWQKYCTEACAGPANREAKRKWWHENKGKGLL
jgi:hypothetical protein